MINLFRNPPTTISTSTPYGWNLVESRIQSNLAKYKSFLSSGGISMNNGLTPLINDMDIKLRDTLEEVIEKVSTNLDTLSQLHSLCYITEGKIKDNIFFNTDSYISCIDIGVNFEEEWYKMSPLRVVKTTNMDLQFKNLDKHQISEDIVYCELDVTQLGIMYYQYLNHMNVNMIPYGIPEFIYQYVLPNTFESFLNLSMLNRFFYMYQGHKPPTHFKTESITGMFSIRSMVDNGYKLILKNTDFEGLSPISVLATIPTGTCSALESLSMRYISTRTVKRRFAFISKLGYFNNVIIMGKVGKSRNNVSYITDVYFVMKSIKNAKMLDNGTGITEGILEDIDTFTDKIMDGIE